VNVGGKSRVEMARLRTAVERLEGFDDVRTYINSGNLMFRAGSTDRAALTERVESAIEDEFGFRVAVLLWTAEELARLVASLPEDCAEDERSRCNVLFLWPEVDDEDVLERMPTNPDVESVRYLPGAVIWQIDRAKASRSRISRLVGTPFYRQLSIRNSNTVRKLNDLLRSNAV
jgi:uncharacterized protein (DUF1697 family)